MFDSGVGGLTVLHECLVSLPHEDFVYLGDTARFPYGERSQQQLRSYAHELSSVLVDRGAKLVVIACNSATAAAFETVKAELDGVVPVVGVVRPESRLAAEATTTGRVGVIATEATVASGAYDRALAEASGGAAQLTSVAAPRLAPLIQAGGEVDEATVACVEQACAPLQEARVDTVILGCTHYPLVRPLLQRTLGRGVRLITSGEAIAETVEAELDALGRSAPTTRRGAYHFLTTGEPEEFRALGTRFLQLPIAKVGHVQAQPTRIGSV
ncbi:MAG TPA: glutamate racemase [Thermoleophilaceae bacterium]|nr:glutamate racemase [Thermoleophilaceae bacterium]